MEIIFVVCFFLVQTFERQIKLEIIFRTNNQTLNFFWCTPQKVSNISRNIRVKLASNSLIKYKSITVSWILLEKKKTIEGKESNLFICLCFWPPNFAGLLSRHDDDEEEEECSEEGRRSEEERGEGGVRSGGSEEGGLVTSDTTQDITALNSLSESETERGVRWA